MAQGLSVKSLIHIDLYSSGFKTESPTRQIIPPRLNSGGLPSLKAQSYLKEQKIN